jgi:F0F1-type ATP synthase alpha subunit
MKYKTQELTGNSDGIARVHGMNNVQAEELVEYAKSTTPLFPHGS